MTFTPHKTKAEAVQLINNVDIVAEQPTTYILGIQTVFVFLFFPLSLCARPLLRTICEVW